MLVYIYFDQSEAFSALVLEYFPTARRLGGDGAETVGVSRSTSPVRTGWE